MKSRRNFPRAAAHPVVRASKLRRHADTFPLPSRIPVDIADLESIQLRKVRK